MSKVTPLKWAEPAGGVGVLKADVSSPVEGWGASNEVARNVVQSCKGCRNWGGGGVCAPVNTRVINGTQEVTRPCVTPDDVSG